MNMQPTTKSIGTKAARDTKSCKEEPLAMSKPYFDSHASHRWVTSSRQNVQINYQPGRSTAEA